MPGRIKKVLQPLGPVRWARSTNTALRMERAAVSLLSRTEPPRAIFDANDSRWREFYVPEATSWAKFVHDRARHRVSEVAALTDRAGRLEQVPIGFVLSTGRSGTRAMWRFLVEAGVPAVHRRGDVPAFERSVVVDPGERNSLLYGQMLDELSDSDLDRHIAYAFDLAEFGARFDQFWYVAHRWNCYLPLLSALVNDVRVIHLTRDPAKVLYSCISRTQYASPESDPGDPTTWVNFEPILESHLPTLRLSGAPIFDRAAWYVSMVGHLANAVAPLTSRPPVTVDVSDPSSLAALPEVLDADVGAGRIETAFAEPVNRKPRSVTGALRFPEPHRWPSVMWERLQEIQGRFTVSDRSR